MNLKLLTLRQYAEMLSTINIVNKLSLIVHVVNSASSVTVVTIFIYIIEDLTVNRPIPSLGFPFVFKRCLASLGGRLASLSIS